MEYAGGQGCIGMSYGEDIAEMLHGTSAAAGYDGDGKAVGQECYGFIGKAFLYAVMVHGRE